MHRNPAEDLSMRQLIERFTVEFSPSHKGHLKEVARMRHTAMCRVWETHVANLKPADIAAWRDQRLKEVAPATVLREIGDLALVLNHAMKEWGIVLPCNSFKNVKRPKDSYGRERRLKELKRFVDLNRYTYGVEPICKVLQMAPSC